MDDGPIYLGMDASTQSFKITAIDRQRRIRRQVAVAFDNECPEFGTRAGVIRNDYGFGPVAAAAAAKGTDGQNDGGGGSGCGEVITAPSLMFVAALERAMEKLRATGLPMHRVAAISGSGQQHGSVYWARGAADRLRSLHADTPLVEQLRDAFSVPNGPMWMDSSSGAQCRQLEHAAGGAQALAELTGSSGYERFTGAQIAKIAAQLPDAFARTERMSLISSMVPSLLLGAYAPIDAADAAGMSLMDLNAAALPFDWSEKLLDACVPGRGPALRGLLGPIVAPDTPLGTVAPCFQRRWGLSPQCQVVAFSGDNPCSLVGLGLERAGDLGVSLGTSDTMLALVPAAAARPLAGLGHVFPHTLDALRVRMLMLCFKNGSLARERVRDQALATAAAASAMATGAATSTSASADLPRASWAQFNSALESTPPGNDGHMFFAFCENEIVPHTRATGYFHYAPPPADAQGEQHPQPQLLHRTPASGEGNGATLLGPRAVRGVLESQFLNMRLQAHRLGLAHPRRILVTGGASTNLPLLQLLADVWGADVEGHTLADADTGAPLGQLADTASLGAAFRALHSSDQRQASMGARSPVEHAPPQPSCSHEEDAQTAPPAADGSAAGAIAARVIRATKLASFRPEVHRLYSDMMARFEHVQALCVQQLNQ